MAAISPSVKSAYSVLRSTISDLDPGPEGQIGQVVLRTHESEPASLLAPSFGVWLAVFAKDLKAGKYILVDGSLERKIPRKVPFKQRIKLYLSGDLQRGTQCLQQYKWLLHFVQHPKQVFSFFMHVEVKQRARDLWLRLRSSLRTRWVRVLAWPVQTAYWSPNGAYLCGVNSQVHLWNGLTGEQLCSFRVAALSEHAVAWSPDGRYLLLTDGERRIQSIQALDGTPISTYTFPVQNASVSPRNYEPVTAVAWSPSGQHIAAGTLQGNVHIWDALNNVLLVTYSWYTWTVYALAWSPDGTRLAVRGSDSTVRAWSADGGRPQ